MKPVGILVPNIACPRLPEGDSPIDIQFSLDDVIVRIGIMEKKKPTISALRQPRKANVNIKG